MIHYQGTHTHTHTHTELTVGVFRVKRMFPTFPSTLPRLVALPSTLMQYLF